MTRILSDHEIDTIVQDAMASWELTNKRILLIVPDATRTAPIGQLFRAIYPRLREAGARADVMIALGTHPPMSEEAICRRLEITASERAQKYGDVGFLNHAWDNPAALATIGTLSVEETHTLTGGLFARDVTVTINRAILDYDELWIVGPVFPHEVVGFSGGNKYLFPGISGPEVLNFFHWLGALVTSPRIMGHRWTPVRKVVDRAASLVPVPRRAFCVVVQDGGAAGCFVGTPEEAWLQATDLSEALHITTVERPFHTVLSCAPAMYDDLWVGAKCMYKLEPIVADGGELIIYAPHIREVSVTHGATIERIGYHVRDYFWKQWERFSHEPWGALAHATHVRGVGTFVDGVETGRIQVTLATGISEAVCRKICLGYRDPATIDPASFAGREAEGILYVPKAGEQLYRLADPPDWARG